MEQTRPSNKRKLECRPCRQCVALRRFVASRVRCTATHAVHNFDDCAREAIHSPGSIQPHGILLVIDASSGLILQASSNAALMFQTPIGSILGASWRSFVRCAPDPDALARRAPEHVRIPHARVLLPTAAPPRARYSGSWHLHPTRWLLEIEVDAEHRARTMVAEFRELVREIEDLDDVEHAASVVARGLRRQLGYDHVMVYRFAPDCSGEVIAEDVLDGMEPYLGLRYPATDIPAQARALYLRMRVRSIGDVAYTPSPLLPQLDPLTGDPTDLGDIALRSVSPVHLEYVTNMGVAATLVVSIIVNAKLWGLVSCHHRTPRFPDHEMRETADMLARAFAARIGMLEREKVTALETRLLITRETMIEHLDGSAGASSRFLHDFSAQLLAMTDADGVALIDQNAVSSAGSIPNAATLLRLRRLLVASAGGTMSRDVPGVLYTDSLTRTFSEFNGSFGDTAGLLYLPLDANAHSVIIWARDQAIRQIRWGRNPYLAKLRAAEGGKLSLRQSFDAWQETVRGHSRRWEPIYLESARMLALLVGLRDRRPHEPDVELLRAALDKVREPMIIFALDPDSGRVDIVHVNEAFTSVTGMSDPLAIAHMWNLDDESTATQLESLIPFRVSHRESDNELIWAPILELQPIIGSQNGRRQWMGLFQRVKLPPRIEPALMGELLKEIRPTRH